MTELELRASDAEREMAVGRLQQACAEGRLTLDEFSQRLDEAYAARTHAELDHVVRELPAAAGVAVRSAPRKRRRWLTVAIFGGADRVGRWRVARRGLVLTLFGGTDVDLRRAELEGPVVTLVAVTIFGGSDVYVPQGVEVDLTSVALFGGNDEHGDEGEIRPGAPLVRIVAISLFGGFDVWHVPAGAEGSPRELIVATLPRALSR